MTVYRRGATWWYEFHVRGQRVRESSHSRSKTLAERAQRERRRAIAEGISYLRAAQPAIFSIHAKEWVAQKQPHWRTNTQRVMASSLRHLNRAFGRTLLTDISANDITRYQAARYKAGASGATINMEVGTLRAVLRKHRLWANLLADVRMLRQRTDIGRALDVEESRRLLQACQKTRSRSLFSAVLISLHTGLRNFELRNLRWEDVDMRRKTLRVSTSKTTGGEGRVIPLTEKAQIALKEWRGKFPSFQPRHFVFPAEKIGFPSTRGPAHHVTPDKQMTSWATSWRKARKDAQVECRWHDLRHTFVSRVAESQVSDSTMMALAGHMSVKMKERYSHTRLEAKRRAIEAI